jgi:hypothetical protein
MDLNKLVEDFVKHCMYNKKSTMEYYDEIKEMREYTVPQFRQVVDEQFNRFCLNNGLWNRLDFGKNENDEAKALIKLWTLGNTDYKFKNRYLNGLVDWFLDKNINMEMNDLPTLDEWTMLNKKDEEVKVAHHFYSKIPPLYLKLKNVQKDKYSITPSDKLIKWISDFIKIGKSIQFNVKGFQMNETLWLLVGMAIVYVKLNPQSTFKGLIKLLRAFIQLNITSICLESDDSKEYNLITFLKTGGEEYNYRYKCAEKYFGNYKKIGKTDYKVENGKTFILTEYNNHEEYLSKWNELENMFKDKGLTKELIVKWFDSQLLTRSTCLIGCILIVLMENGTIEFIKDEMPDWKAIGLGTIDGTYVVKEALNIPKDIPKDWKLVDVLSTIAYYISTLKK